MILNYNNKNAGKNFFYKYYRIIVIPVVFLLYLFSYYILNPYADQELDSLFVLGWTLDILLLLLYCGILTELSLFVGRTLNRWISWEQKPLFRAVVQFVFIIVGNILLNYFFSYLWLYFYPLQPLKESELIVVWQSNIMAGILSLFISFVHTGIFLLNRWRITSEEASELKLRAAKLEEHVTRSELEVLKLQLDPHFIFNNFSALTELIYEDQNAAAAFLDNMTKVYRYMISNLTKNTITLKEEIEFLNSYFYLVKTRHGEKIKLNISISPGLLDKMLPPLTLQLLVENAIKHNTATMASPLEIFIYTDMGSLIVKNALQRTAGMKFTSTGIGNKNIEFRYKILFDKVPIFVESDGFYIVRLPLM